MIVDTYTHIWESADQLGRSFEHLKVRAFRQQKLGQPDQPEAGFSLPPASAQSHLQACQHTDKAIVLGFKSHYLQADVPNDYVAEYVLEHPGKLLGFVTVDPSKPAEALQEMERGHRKLGLQGVAIAPAAQDFHPSSSNAYLVYEKIAELHLPLLIHQGIYFSSHCKLEYARPALLDEIAREFPDMRIIVAHMGYPWIDETVVLLEKHPNVFADVSGLLTQTWRAYNALLTAHQYGVIDKLLFASGFPFHSAVDCIEALYSINQICQGTSLPIIPRAQLRGIVERPALTLLGIEPVDQPNPEPASSSASQIIADDDC